MSPPDGEVNLVVSWLERIEKKQDDIGDKLDEFMVEQENRMTSQERRTELHAKIFWWMAGIMATVTGGTLLALISQKVSTS